MNIESTAYAAALDVLREAYMNGYSFENFGCYILTRTDAEYVREWYDASIPEVQTEVIRILGRVSDDEFKTLIKDG